MAHKLPAPATAQDFYAAAIVDELRQVNATLAQLAAAMQPQEREPFETGEVDLREPVDAPPVKDYDSLTADDIIARAGGWSDTVRAQVRAYEAANKGRKTVLAALGD